MWEYSWHYGPLQPDIIWQLCWEDRSDEITWHLYFICVLYNCDVRSWKNKTVAEHKRYNIYIWILACKRKRNWCHSWYHCHQRPTSWRRQHSPVMYIVLPWCLSRWPFGVDKYPLFKIHSEMTDEFVIPIYLIHSCTVLFVFSTYMNITVIYVISPFLSVLWFYQLFINYCTVVCRCEYESFFTAHLFKQ